MVMKLPSVGLVILLPRHSRQAADHGPGLGVSSGVTLCLVVCWGERVVSRCVTIGPDYITRGLYIHLSFNNETK